MSFKSRVICSAAILGAGLMLSTAQAQTPAPADAKPADAKPAEPAPPYTFTGNFGIFSQYIFRGLTQTNQTGGPGRLRLHA